MMDSNHRFAIFLAWLIALGSIFLSIPTATADSGELRSQWQQDIQSTRQLQLELAEALEQMHKETGIMQAQLRKEANRLSNAMPSASALRDARLELEMQNAWAQTLENRASYRQREINALNQEMGSNDDPLLAQLIKQKMRLLETLEEFNEARRSRVYIAKERLAQLQSRIDLWSIGFQSGTLDDPRISLIEGVITGLIRNSIRLTNKATEIAATDPQDSAQRQRLELEADDAATRATLRQTDIDILRLDQWLEIVDSMLEDETMPASNLLQASDTLQWTEKQLQSRLDSLGKRRAIIETQKSIASTHHLTGQNQLNTENDGLLIDLESLIHFQEEDLNKRLWRINTIQKEMNASMESVVAHPLLVRQSLPQSGKDWLRVTDSLLSAPKKLLKQLHTGGANIYSRLSSASTSSWIRLLGAIIVLTIIAAGIQRWLAWLLPATPAHLWQSVASEAASAVWWLVPIGAWLWMSALFDLSTQHGQRGLLMLLAWPAYRIARGYIQYLYTTSTRVSGTELTTRNCTLRRRAKIISILALIFALLSHWINATGVAAIVFDRLFMACIFALTLTAFQAHRANLSVQAEPQAKSAIGILQAIGVLVLIVTIIGFLGYSRFAWLIFYHVFWIATFTTFMWLMISTIRASTARLSRVYRARELNTTAMWLFSVLHPLSLIVIFALGVTLLYLLLAVFSWGIPSPLLIWIRDASGLSSLQADTFLLSEPGRRFSRAVIDITIALLLAYVLWEVIKRSMQRYMPEERDSSEIGGEGGGTGASRISTLMPLLRKLIFITISVITVMVILSALGVNIGPLLAGAGVVGIAVGFGAQALVKDIISGVFFLMDDAFRMGEYVNISGDIKGTVERISIRSLQLRHHNGPVHTIPFGEIQFLTNFSRDWAIMKFEFRIGFETDIDVVRRIIKKVGMAMMEDEEFGPLMLEPLKSQGVNRMDDSALIIRCKFTAIPGQQFYVRRQAFTLIQRAFEDKGIQFAPKRVIVDSSSAGDDAAQAAAAAAEEADQGDNKK